MFWQEEGRNAKLETYGTEGIGGFFEDKSKVDVSSIHIRVWNYRHISIMSIIKVLDR